MLMAILMLLADATSAGNLAWKLPPGWTVDPRPSQMRLATLKVPAAAGDAEGGELAIFFFGAGQGGTVDANVQRWIGQFKSEPGVAKTRTEMVKDVKVTRVQTEGTYGSGMPGGATTPRENFALQGAIAEGSGGAVFFKLTGPKKTVQKAAPQFDALIKSLSRR